LAKQKEQSIMIGNEMKITAVDNYNYSVPTNQVDFSMIKSKGLSAHRKKVHRAVQKHKAGKLTIAKKTVIALALTKLESATCIEIDRVIAHVCGVRF
jgi:sRNA-binding carbon storage regulator CsrA